MRIYLLLVYFLSTHFISEAQTDSILYSFVVAGHTYGTPGIDNVGFHPPFKAKFTYIQGRPEIEFVVLTGDVIPSESDSKDWDEIDADIEELDIPFYIAVGNHDIENRPLFENRYGSTYYEFIYKNDLIIVLDPNIDCWDISGDQLLFLQNAVESNYRDVDNIFVFFHQLLWQEPNNIYQNLMPNSYLDRKDNINFWTVIEPIFNALPNEVYFFSGDLGATAKGSKIAYDHYDNISLIGSGMGYTYGENFVVVNVLKDKSVQYDLIYLEDIDDCICELQEYQLTSDSTKKSQRSFNFRVFQSQVGEVLKIELGNDLNAEFGIYDLMGQEIATHALAGESITKIDLSKLQLGVYIGQIQNNLIKENFKLIIQDKRKAY